jgi:helicase
VLYNEWLRGEKAEEVINSLGMELAGTNKQRAHELACLATLRAILLWELSSGAPIEDLERRWKVTNLGGVEERWRDERLWLLSGVAEIFDVRCFFFFLKAELAADEERILKLKRLLQRVRLVTYDCIGRIKFSSPIGGFVAEAKRLGTKLGIGPASLEKLESLGARSAMELATISDEHMLAAGLRSYLARRLRGN